MIVPGNGKRLLSSERKKRIVVVKQWLVWRAILQQVPLIFVVLLWIPLVAVPLTTIWQDGALYLLQAQSYAMNGLGPASAQYIYSTRTLLFPLLLTLAFKLGGISVASAALVVKGGLALCVLATYLIGRRIGGWFAGLLAVILVTSAEYMIVFATDAKLDAVQSAFMLASLYLLISAMHSKKGVFLSVLSGFSLGLAFWIKETAIIWLPLPFFALLLSRAQVRTKHDLTASHVVAFETTCGFAVICWWAFYYLQTSSIWLVGISVGSGDRYRVAIGVILFLLLTLLWLGRKTLEKAVTGFLYLPRWSGIVLFVIWSAILTLILIPRGQPIHSLGDLPARFTWIPRFFRDIVFPSQPFLLAAMISWPIVLFSSLRRKPVFQILLISACLYFPIVFLISTPSAGRSWTPRHLMTLFLLSYVCAGAVTAEAFRWALSLAQSARSPKWLQTYSVAARSCIVVILSATALFHSTQISMHYIQSDPLKGVVWFNYAVQDTASWLEDNVPAGSSILFLDKMYSYSVQFLTGARYDFQLSESGLQVLMGSQADSWYLGDRSKSPQKIAGQYYLRDFSESPPYLYAFDSERLLEEIHSGGVQYVVAVVGPQRTCPAREPRYIQDNPLFERAFHKDWNGYAIDIYKVRSTESMASEIDYPVEVDYESLVLWMERISAGHEPYDEYAFLRTIGNSGLLIDTEPSQVAKAAPLYLQIGQVFADHGDQETAAFEYRMALSADPNTAQEILQKAEEMTTKWSDEAGPWLLLAEVQKILGQIDMAQAAYSRAIQLHAERAETWAAAHRGVGQLYLLAGNDEQAIDEFERSLELGFFDASQTRQQLWLAWGKLYLAKGDMDQAFTAYNQALLASVPGQGQITLGSAEPVLLDLVQQFSAAKTHSLAQEKVHPTVFDIEDESRQVLFAHPPTWISYTLQVPTAAVLRFAPVLAPEVWNLDHGDGTQFDIYVDDGLSHRHVFSKYINPKEMPGQQHWTYDEVNLNQWAGQTVTVTFATDAGPNNNDSYDWAAWGEPRIVRAMPYDFLRHFSEAKTTTLAPPGEARLDLQSMNSDPRFILYQHPSSQVSYSLTLPSQPKLHFGIGMDPAIWSPEYGDGAEYNIYVRTHEQPVDLYRVFHQYVDPKNDSEDRHWFDEEIDLGRFAAQSVEIIFEVLPGPKGDPSFDWGGWSDPVLVDETPPPDAQIDSAASP